MDVKDRNASLIIRRTFDAPITAVYNAWTNAHAIAQWLAPEERYAITVYKMDVQPGGAYRIGMKLEEKNIEHIVGGIYEVIQPLEKLVFSWQWEQDKDNAGNTKVTVELKDAGGKTEMILTHERFSTEFASSEHTKGWNGCFDRLAGFVQNTA